MTAKRKSVDKIVLKALKLEEQIVGAVRAFVLASMPVDAEIAEVDVAAGTILASHLCFSVYEAGSKPIFHPVLEALLVNRGDWAQLVQKALRALMGKGSFLILMPSPYNVRIGVATPTIFYPDAVRTLEVFPSEESLPAAGYVFPRYLFGLPPRLFGALLKHGTRYQEELGKQSLKDVQCWIRVPDESWTDLHQRFELA